jgi:uncharacterized protein YuzE
MKITYDPEVDALYIQLKDGEPGSTKIIEDGVHVDMDPDQHIIGIEILYARDRFGDKNVGTVLFENLALTMPDEECEDC